MNLSVLWEVNIHLLFQEDTLSKLTFPGRVKNSPKLSLPQMHSRKMLNSILSTRLPYRGFKRALGLSTGKNTSEWTECSLQFPFAVCKTCFMNAAKCLHLYTKYKSNTGHWHSFSEIVLHLLQVVFFLNLKTRNHSWCRRSLLPQTHRIFHRVTYSQKYCTMFLLLITSAQNELMGCMDKSIATDS